MNQEWTMDNGMHVYSADSIVEGNTYTFNLCLRYCFSAMHSEQIKTAAHSVQASMPNIGVKFDDENPIPDQLYSRAEDIFIKTLFTAIESSPEFSVKERLVPYQISDDDLIAVLRPDDTEMEDLTSEMESYSISQ